jgi:hypothetical protein
MGTQAESAVLILAAGAGTRMRSGFTGQHTSTDLLRRADHAVLAANHAGGNQIACKSPSTTSAPVTPCCRT